MIWVDRMSSRRIAMMFKVAAKRKWQFFGAFQPSKITWEWNKVLNILEIVDSSSCLHIHTFPLMHLSFNNIENLEDSKSALMLQCWLVFMLKNSLASGWKQQPSETRAKKIIVSSTTHAQALRFLQNIKRTSKFDSKCLASSKS